jgi:hypothetical protein
MSIIAIYVYFGLCGHHDAGSHANVSVTCVYSFQEYLRKCKTRMGSISSQH